MRVFSLLSLGALALSATVSQAAFETYASVPQSNRITNVDAERWSQDTAYETKCALGDVLFIRFSDDNPARPYLTKVDCVNKADTARSRLNTITKFVSDGPWEQFSFRLDTAEKNPENHLRDLRVAFLYAPVGMFGAPYIPSGTLRDGQAGEIPLQMEMIRGQASLTSDERATLLKSTESEIKDWLKNDARVGHEVLKVLGFVSEIDLGGFSKVTLHNASVRKTKDARTFLIRSTESPEMNTTIGLSGVAGYWLLKKSLDEQNTADFKSLLDQVSELNPIGLRFTAFPASR